MARASTLAVAGRVGLMGLSLLCSCASKDSGGGSRGGDASAPPSLGNAPAEARFEFTHDVVRSVYEHFQLPVINPSGEPRTIPLLRPGEVETIDMVGGELRPRIIQSALRAMTHPAEVQLPVRSADPFRVTEKDSGMWIEVATRGAEEVQAEQGDGFVVYRGALAKSLGLRGSGHVIHRVTAAGTEDYITLDSAPATSELSYEVRLGDKVAGLRVVADTVEFVDQANGPRLRMSPPYLVDAKGQQHKASATVTGCKYDSSPVAPWGRQVTPPGARNCTIRITWTDQEIAWPAVLDPVWSSAGTMVVGRRYHTLTPVQKDKFSLVLAVGGVTPSSPSDTAELYSVSDKTWAATGTPGGARGYHTALPVSPLGTVNGKVWIFGGLGAGNVILSDGRMYDPSTGTFTATADSTIKRIHHSAMRLDDGTMLIVGGSNNFTPLAGTVLNTSQMYIPSTNTWPASAKLTLVKGRAQAMLLQVTPGSLGSTVIVLAGGTDGTSALTSAEQLKTAAWSTTGISPLPSAMKDGVGYGSGYGMAIVTGYQKLAYRLETGGTWTSLGPTTYTWDHPVSAPLHHSGYEFLMTSSAYYSSLGYTEVYRQGFLNTDYPGDHRWGAAAYVTDLTVLVSGGTDYASKMAHLYTAQAQASPCTHPGDCVSKYCVDGFCCNTECTGLCQACSAAKKYQGSDGVCGNILAGKPGEGAADCPDDGAGTCDRNGMCDGSGACQLYANLTQCADSVCSTGLITHNKCNGLGDCLPAQVSCTPYQCESATACRTGCAADSHCYSTHYCNGSLCVPKKAQGDSCSGSNECTSNFCVDSVCCNEACTGLCKGCSAAVKGSGGGDDGECGFVVKGHDLQNECVPDAQETCGNNGTCNGDGTCGKWLNVSCGTTWCDNNTLKGKICDGNGFCVNDATGGTPCSPYLCQGISCTSPCVADSSCVSGYFCDNGTCRSRLGNGQPCSAATQCVSGNCVDNYCCDTACSGLCYACSAARKHQGDNGECGPVLGGFDDDNDCAVGSECKEDGTCNGSGSCRMVVAGVPCGGTVCLANSVAGQHCNGSGSCVNNESGSNCAPFICSSGACSTPCATDSHCLSGYFCDNGACTLKVQSGTSCTSGAQCNTGYCVDGVCCDNSCSGLCQACTMAKKGSGSDGICGAISLGTDPDGECATGTECGTTGFCDGAGACDIRDAGTACGATQCVGNKVTGQICNGSGLCINDTVGTECAPYLCSGGACTSPCVSDSQCITNYACIAGSCVQKKAAGAPCSTAAECALGYCVDGVCCATACSGLCSACSASKKGSGNDGECGGIALGTDPDSECDIESGCGRDGTCNGSGACRLKVAGVSCGASQCLGNKVTGQVCDGAGLCVNDSTGTECSPYLCSAGACSSPCASDSNCVTGSYCANGVCIARKSAGATCGVPNECVSGNCVDGVCCDSACSGLCRACSSAKKGAGANGECGPIVTGADPDAECEVEAGCGKDGTCNGAGACRLKVSGVSCGSSQCVLNKVTGQVCDGNGLCVNDSVGTECSPYVCSGGACSNPCVADSNCLTGYYCGNGTCSARKSAGQACTAANECTSGFCTDGVCCSAACSGLCQACSAAKKGGGANGECGGIAAGTDPENECDLESGCGKDGTCNGSGACRLKISGSSCGASQCLGNKVTGQVCDGSGLCINDAVGTECAPFLCSAGACSSPCVSDSHCVLGNYCTGGICKAKKATGVSCSQAHECNSGNCVDGVCCDSACSSLCRACSAARKGAGIDGECGPIVSGSDPDSECEVEAGCGKDGTCSGSGACRLKQSGVSCGSSQCVLNKVTGQVCDGMGLCINDAVGTDCGAYVCSGGACSNPCVADSNCTAGNFCISGTCSPKKSGGTSCATGNECTSGFCVDGVCCNTACSGLCSACSASKKGAGLSGECGAIVAGADPDGECQLEADCGQDGTCNGSGACRLKLPGVSCGSSQCVGNTVKGQVCDGSGLCINDATGTDCTPHLCSGGACVNPCVADANCMTGYFCSSGTCVAKKAVGQACSGANQCTSGFCADGFCCNSTCSGLCAACSAAKKGAGANGECGSIAAGADPDDECAAEPGCGKDGTCNGLGACRVKVAGVSCGASQCVQNKVTGQVCDGNGLCINNSVGTDCGAYVCSGGACANPCVSDANCAVGHFCANGECVSKKVPGGVCSATNECNSGYCVDGVCCDTACSGLCRACTAAKKGAGADGECGAIGSGADPDEECQTESGCGKDGTCNGSGACRLKLAGVSCGSSQCVGNSAKGQVCDGSGLCINDATGTDCTPSLCSGGACKSPCLADTDCVSGYFCSSGTCTPKKAVGESCTVQNECELGYCADGVCCNTACSGFCSACSQAKKGIGQDGECGFIQTGADPDFECDIEAGCGKDGTCDGQGSCRLKQAGVSCGTSQCVENKVTGQQCDGHGNCQNNSVGTPCGAFLCANGTCNMPCLSDAHCVTGNFCSQGTCVPLLDAGMPCTGGSQCKLGYCADGVCCNVACSSPCAACSAALKESGIDGECGPAKMGTDPHNDCQKDLPSSCQRDGECDGVGACRLYQEGEKCGTSACMGNDLVGQVCNGIGTCTVSDTPTACSPYMCSSALGTCATGCQSNSECYPADKYWCQAGKCVEKGDPGDDCTNPSDCLSGFCVDKVCCDTECTGQCQACDLGGSKGTCSLVTGAPHGSRPKCDGAGTPCEGTCNGALDNECAYQTGNACGSTCSNGTETPKVCDGKGGCEDTTTKSCAPYQCDKTSEACLTECKADTDCISSASCNVNTGKCEQKGATCKDDFTVMEPGGTLTDCRPFKCSAGSCRGECVTTNDCASGYDCAGGKCVLGADSDAGEEGGEAATSVSQNTGCGCSTPGESRAPRSALILSLLLGAIALRRRARDD